MDAGEATENCASGVQCRTARLERKAYEASGSFFLDELPSLGVASEQIRLLFVNLFDTFTNVMGIDNLGELFGDMFHLWRGRVCLHAEHDISPNDVVHYV